MDLVKRARFALCALMLVVFGFGMLSSCAPEPYDDNPCITGKGLHPLQCGIGACSRFIDVLEICPTDDSIPITCSPGNPQQADTCGDGLDNDCDGFVDENDSGDCTCKDVNDKGNKILKLCFTGSPENRNKGICHDGKQPCENGAWGQCQDDALPSSEICDGLDNNCNGEVDEGCECPKDGAQQFCYDGPESTIDHGVCHQGQQTCKDGKWGKCIGSVIPTLETCTSEDLDCDGTPGNGSNCECVTDVDTEPCYTGPPGTEGVGTCRGGTHLCKNGHYDKSKCLLEVTPQPEVCNGKDDDCDGQPDNALPGTGMACLPKGAPCTNPTDCLSTFCVDGFCCDTSCTGTCQACSASKRGAGDNGTCGPIAEDTDPDEECPTQAPATCDFKGVCDGAGSCAKYSKDTICAPAACKADGVTVHNADTCDGNGNCIAGTNEDCSPYTCFNEKCRTSCTSDAECAPGLHCNNASKCVPCVVASHCPGQDTECQTRTCIANQCGIAFVPTGTAVSGQVAGDCHENQCNGAGVIVSVIKDTDTQDDGNQCTFDSCNTGVPSHTPTASGTTCSQNGGSVCNGNSQCVQCVAAVNCPGQDTECQTRTCISGVCGFSFTPVGTPVSTQSPGDCRENQCNGSGGILSAIKDADVPNDNNPCTNDVCSSGIPSNPSTASGTACSQNGGLVCNGAGQCVGCVSASNCPGIDNECQSRTCTSGTCGIAFVPAGTPTAIQTAGDCKENQCNGAGAIVIANKNTDIADDGNACTSDICSNGSAASIPLPSGTACNQNGGTVCNGSAQCVQCLSSSTCPGVDTECQTRTCNNGTCGFTFAPIGTPTLTQTPGDCRENQCNGSGAVINVVKDTDIPVDGNQCTDNLCLNGNPSNPNSSAGTLCNQGGGAVCNGGGQCVQCLSASTCPGQDDECQSRTCNNGVCGKVFVAANTLTPTQIPGDCKDRRCDGAGGFITTNSTTDVLDDGNQCTSDICSNGTPQNQLLPAGTACSQGGFCNSGGQCVQCVVASNCPGVDTECRKRTCDNGVCSFINISSGTPTLAQTAGDCRETQCDGAGSSVSVVKDTDLPVDGNQCTSDVCVNGTPSNPNSPSGTTCSQNGGSVCNGSGTCVQCITASTCPNPPNECSIKVCSASGVCGFIFVAAGTPISTQTPGDCLESQCNGSGAITNVAKDTDLPNDGNACTTESCASGSVVSSPVASGTACNQNGGSVCNGTGSCVQCITASNCPGVDTECQTRTCNSGTCGNQFTPADTPTLTQTPGDCKENQCDGKGNSTSVKKDSDVPDDGNACTTESCSNGSVVSSPVASGTSCSNQNGGKVCNGSGACVECLVSADCTFSKICGSNNTCSAPTCADGVLNGFELGTDCGGTSCPACSTVLILAGGTSGMLGGEFHPGGVWNTQTLTSANTSSGVALKIPPSGKGVGLVRNQGGAGDNELRFTTWTGDGNAVGIWADFAIVAAGVKTNAAPTITVGSTGDAHAAYIASPNDYRYAAFNGSTWAPTAEIINSLASSTAPTAPQITFHSTGPVLAYYNSSNSALYSADRNVSTWTAFNAMPSPQIASISLSNSALSPAIVTLSSGIDLVVWVDGSGSLRFNTRQSGGASWASVGGGAINTGSGANAIKTDKPVSLAALPSTSSSGQAVLAFRGTNGLVYTSFFNGTTWNAIAAVPSTSTITTPAITHGVGTGADAAVVELAVIETDNIVYHRRLRGSTWTTPVAVGGTAMESVAIASTP